jgi:lipid A 4'-phosphatase
LRPTDQCLDNCSFVSGEASGAAALAVSVWIVSSRMESPTLRRLVRWSMIAAAVLAAFLRVAKGRHFLSDIIFAGLIVTGLALALSWVERRVAALKPSSRTE